MAAPVDALGRGTALAPPVPRESLCPPGHGPSKIFVGGFGPAVTEAHLEAAFAPFGSVLETRVVLDRATGRSKGYGFVTFANSESAADAVNAPGVALDGRPCTVNYATNTDLRRSQDVAPDAQHREAPHAPPGLAPSPYAFLAGTPGDKRLFIASLPPAVSEERLRELVGVLGEISDCRIVMDRETGQSKGYGFITFYDAQCAAKAALVGTLHIDGRRCPINLASAKAKRSSEGFM